MRVVTYPYTVQTVEIVDENGDHHFVEIINSPAKNAIRRGNSNTWFVFSSEPLADGAKVLSGAAMTNSVPLRTDLPEEHQIHGERALSEVPSGVPDIILRGGKFYSSNCGMEHAVDEVSDE